MKTGINVNVLKIILIIKNLKTFPSSITRVIEKTLFIDINSKYFLYYNIL